MRMALNLTLDDVAVQTGISRSSLHGMEMNDRPITVKALRGYGSLLPVNKPPGAHKPWVSKRTRTRGKKT